MSDKYLNSKCYYHERLDHYYVKNKNLHNLLQQLIRIIPVIINPVVIDIVYK